jgi:hypothetical protein
MKLAIIDTLDVDDVKSFPPKLTSQRTSQVEEISVQCFEDGVVDICSELETIFLILY